MVCRSVLLSIRNERSATDNNSSKSFLVSFMTSASVVSGLVSSSVIALAILDVCLSVWCLQYLCEVSVQDSLAMVAFVYLFERLALRA